MVAEKVLAGAGAVKRVTRAGWVTQRDALDQQVVQNYRDGTGSLRNASDFSDSWYPRLAQGSLEPDMDADGMADDWELDQFGTLSHNGISDLDQNGYPDREDYWDGRIVQIPVRSELIRKGVIEGLPRIYDLLGRGRL